MSAKDWFLLAGASLILLAVGCEPKKVQVLPPPAPPAPAPKQNVFALLPDSDGKVGRILVTNSAGEQELNQPYQAVRVEQPDRAPSLPFTLDQEELKRLFGTALEILPTAEVSFDLHFLEAQDQLTAESQKLLPEILGAIQERRSTLISITGHTDTTGNPQSNYQLGLKRAERVAGLLRKVVPDASSLFVTSHGEADLLVKTPRGVSEPRNRRVVVIVR